MANFNEAYKVVLRHEGGYVNLLSDKGGETYRGIARNRHPGWVGWTLVDEHKHDKSGPVGMDGDAALQAMVRDFYQVNFWKYNGINDQKTANKVMDMAVNLGPRQAHKLLQRAINAAGGFCEIDGAYGLETQKALNECDPCVLYPKLQDSLAKFYLDLLREDPVRNAKFINGWLNRAYDKF